MRIKRALSLILSVSMLLSLTILPAKATSDNLQVTANLVSIDLDQFTGTVKSSLVTPASSVSANQVIALQVVAKK